MTSKIHARIAILALTGLLLLSGCISEYNDDEEYCIGQDGKFSYTIGWDNDNACDLPQEDGKYKRYLIVDTNRYGTSNWILVEA